MKNSDVASTDRSPESGEPQRSTKEPLHTRLYFSAPLTDLVRAFGYESVPLEDARARIAQLTERYGRKPIEDAAEELLDVRSDPGAECARLKESVRKLAAGILGRPPAYAPPPPKQAEPVESDIPENPLDDNVDGEMDLRDDEPEEEEDGNVSSIDATPGSAAGNASPETPAGALPDTSHFVPHGSAAALGKPVRRAIKEVQTGFATWVADIGKNAEQLSAERLRELSPQTRTVPEYILRFGASPALVIIRPSLSKVQRHDLQDWQRVFGVHHEVLRIWPVKQQLRWIWTAETVFPATENASSQNAKHCAKPDGPADVPPGPAPDKSTDYSQVLSRRLDLLTEEIEGLDEMLRQADKIQRQLRDDLEGVRNQLQRALPDIEAE